MKSTATSLILSVITALALAACGDDGGTPGGGTDATTDGTTVSDGAATDAPAPTDGTTATDAPTSGGPGVQCNGDTCDGDQICCLTGGQGGGLTCMTAAECDTASGTSFACDGPEDCTAADTVCCIRNGSSCTATAECRGVQACSVDDDCTEQAPSCCAVPGTPFKVCAARCAGA